MQSKKETQKSFSFGEWKDYPHTPGTIQVSDKGWVRDVKSGRITQGHRAGKKPKGEKKEYLWYTITKPDGSKYTHPVHCMVLETFVCDCPDGMQCHHINSKPWDNRLENLKWVTPKENNTDEHHLRALGKSVVLMDLDGNILGVYDTCASLARDKGCSPQLISKLCLKRGRQKTLHGKYIVQFNNN